MESHLLLPSSVTNSLPAMVKNELAKMGAQKQEEFLEEFKRKSKSKATAYILLLLLWMHYGYIGKWGMQFLFWFTWGGMGVWFLIDLFRLNGIMNNISKDTATDVMRNLKAIS